MRTNAGDSLSAKADTGQRRNVVMVGKGERAWLYRVIRKESQSVAIVEYVRSL